MKKYFGKKHLTKLYFPLYESVLSCGIIHWRGSRHIRPFKVLQNKVCRVIGILGKLNSETEIYSDMPIWRVEELYKYRLLMFLFKHKELFSLRHVTVGADVITPATRTRATDGPLVVDCK